MSVALLVNSRELIFWHEPNIVPLDDIKDRSEQTASNVGAPPQQSIQEEEEVELPKSKGILDFPLHRRITLFVKGSVSLTWNVIARLELLFWGPVHFIEGLTDGVEVQELDVVQTVVQSVVLMQVTSHEVGEMDEAGVNEGPGRVTENDRLEFRNRKEESELNEVGNELEPAGRITKSVTSLQL